MVDRPTADRLVQAAETALANSDRYSAPDYRVEARAATAAVLRELAALDVSTAAEESGASAREMAAFALMFPHDPLIKQFKRLTDLVDQIEQENTRGQ